MVVDMSIFFKDKIFYINKGIGNAELYSFIIDDNIYIPENKIIYDEGCAGYTPAKVNFTTGKIDYGSWADAFFMKVRPCMQYYNGSVAYYLNPNNYKQKENGGVSDNTNMSFAGNTMIEFPKIFLKVEDLGNKKGKITIADKRVDNQIECYTNIDENNNEIDHYYMGAYAGNLNNNIMRSMSGVAKSHGGTFTNFLNYVNANNNGDSGNRKQWSGLVRCDFQLLRFLLMLISKTTDIRGAFGYGNSGGNKGSGTRTLLKTGTMDDKGLFFGAAESKTGTPGVGVKVFGIEDLWGDIGYHIFGQIVEKGNAYNKASYKVKMTKGTYDGSTANEYNAYGEGFIELPSEITPYGVVNSYVLTDNYYTKYGMLPKKQSKFTTNLSEGYTNYVFTFGSTNNVKYSMCLFTQSHISYPYYGIFTEDARKTTYSSTDYVGNMISCKPVKGNGNN